MQRLVAVTQPEEEYMPKKITITSIPAADLAYAVGRLVTEGKTTAAEVLQLAADRGQRIALLEAELKELRQGGTVAAPASKTGRPAARRVRKVAPRKLAAAPKARATKPATAPVKPHLSPKLLKFRRVQGLYAGYLRGFTGATRDRLRAINAENGPAAALAEMKKLLAGKGAPTKVAKPAPATKATSNPAPRKLKISPKRKAQLKLQGVYIGMIRGLPDAAKAKIKAVAKDKGFAAAIEVMRKGGK